MRASGMSGDVALSGGYRVLPAMSPVGRQLPPLKRYVCLMAGMAIAKMPRSVAFSTAVANSNASV